MGGLFGIVPKDDCVSGLFYGTDYHSHLGTHRGGMVSNSSGNLHVYARAGSERNRAMIEGIRKRLRLTTLKYQRLEDLVGAIGLPKEKLCTHCWDGSSSY